MWARLFLAAIVLSATAGPLWAQAARTGPETPGSLTWRPVETVPSGASGATMATAIGPSGNPAAAATPRHFPLRVTAGNGTLPNEQGQVWREYDISPYTSRVTSTKRPEQAIVDWILRETGYEAWHSEPLGILSATPRTLRVYHTPRMHAVVAELVERFVASEAETRTFSLRVVTIDSPSWRAKAQRILRPVPAQTPGVCAWVLPKEEAAILLADLQHRPDYREHSSPHLLVNNGQSTVVSSMRGRVYIRDAISQPNAWQGVEAQTAQVNEGFSMEFSPLVSSDRRTIDAIVKCEVDQVERLVPVLLEVPTQGSARQRTKIEVPQISQFRFNERFRWPVDQVLLVGMGMVALPVPIDGTPSVAGLPLPLPALPPRADLVVVIESKGPVAETPGAARAPQHEATSALRRYDSMSPR